MQSIPQEFRDAYQEYDREMTIRKTRLGCIIGIIMVPVFSVLDHYVYEENQQPFWIVRLICLGLMALLYRAMGTAFARKYYRLQGVILLLIPSATVAWMIYATEGSASPYYAGLNLALMVLAVVLDWTFWQSLTSVVLVLMLYLFAAFLSGPIVHFGIFLNNLFFLISTGVVIVAGSYYHSQLRIRDFVSRHELDKNRGMLAKQNQALEVTIKQLKDAEMQLVQSEKLASLGRMSAGLIHEINNPLNFATTGLFTLRNKGKHLAPEQQADYAEVLQDVEEGIKRVKTIISDLRTFSHPNTEMLDQVEVSEILAQALRFMSNEWKDKVHIEQNLTGHQTIWANKTKLIQVMTNLLQNSLDALGTKSFNNGEKPTIWITGKVEDGRSILIVRDNGPGIGTEHLDKIFDPFFTTKDVGQGMGLGLSICYRIVHECDGKISVKTESGKYCEFTLEFPVKG